MERQRQANRAQKMRDRPDADIRPLEWNDEGEKGADLNEPEQRNLNDIGHKSCLTKRAGAQGSSALFFVFFFFGGAETCGRAERFAVIVERQVAGVQVQRAGGGFLIDNDGDGAAFDAHTESNAAATGESRVRESFQHPLAIISPAHATREPRKSFRDVRVIANA